MHCWGCTRPRPTAGLCAGSVHYFSNMWAPAQLFYAAARGVGAPETETPYFPPIDLLDKVCAPVLAQRALCGTASWEGVASWAEVEAAALLALLASLSGQGCLATASCAAARLWSCARRVSLCLCSELAHAACVCRWLLMRCALA